MWGLVSLGPLHSSARALLCACPNYEAQLAMWCDIGISAAALLLCPKAPHPGCHAVLAPPLSYNAVWSHRAITGRMRPPQHSEVPSQQ